MANNFEQFRELMLANEIDELVITSFRYLYDKLAAGEKGKLTRDEIEQPANERLTDYADLQAGNKAPWDKLAIIKLNGGLGTSMGLDRAKSLLKVRNEHTFLDIIARQIISQRQQKNISIPLLFMNSFNTSADTLSYLEKYTELKANDLPLDFLQNKFPKVVSETLQPLRLSEEKDNWNPPGHGEIYMVMKKTGVLDLLLAKGYEYIFISNSDNLGAVADARILQYMSEQKLPFIMEVCHRSEMDKKGGHLAQDKMGRLILRETAQCPDNEIEEFQDIDHYKYFNTNNLWIDLIALNQKLMENDNFLQLTPIMNQKTVNGIEVIQLESAMGAAINVFAESRAVIVNRDRFVPVKKTNEFLALRSDAYFLDENWQIKLKKGKNNAPQVQLDERYYKTISEFEQRMNDHYPSLQNCEEFSVDGDLYFGENVVIEGKVKISAVNTRLLENRKLKDECITLNQD
ncbi:MAG: UTP--glucose-1-phosphate uridylyltransferase [Candidatus Cloacimonetes bacterium]|nr:UTP--glucose-1-phosphate uridylyltransferase [Candidatus Cloacimonadota bacterium]